MKMYLKLRKDKMSEPKDMTKELFKRHLKILFYMVLAIIAGTVGASMCIMDADINLNTRFIGVIFMVSFVGHMISLLEIIKS